MAPPPGQQPARKLLGAAGLPPEYLEAPLTGAELTPNRAAMDQMLRAHEPYPAMVVDAHLTVLFANSGCALLFGSEVLGVNMVRHVIANLAAVNAIVNWPEVAWAGFGTPAAAARPGPTR